MERIAPLRRPIAASSARRLLEPSPGGNAGRDSARHYAAVGIFSLAGLAVLGFGVWLLQGHTAPEVADRLFSFDPGFTASGVAADAPMLRPSLGAAGEGSVTVFDGATGQSEVMSGPDRPATALLDGGDTPTLR